VSWAVVSSLWKNVRPFASISLARPSRSKKRRKRVNPHLPILPTVSLAPAPTPPTRPRPALHPRVLSALPPSRLRIPFALGLAADLAAPFCAASPRAICLAAYSAPRHPGSSAARRPLFPRTLVHAAPLFHGRPAGCLWLCAHHFGLGGASSRKWEVGAPTPKVQS
jgi:hypothetical protein